MFARTLHVFTAVVGLAAALALLPAPASAQTDGGRPVTWNTYLGGGMAGGTGTPAQDELEAVVVNRNGEVYVTGKTNAALFPASQDGTRTTADSDVVITRISTDGGVVWSRVIGGTGEDVGKRIAFHHPNEGHLLVSGTTTSASIRDGGFPVVGSLAGGKSPFLARVELDGKITWFMYLQDAPGGEAQDLSIFPDLEWAYVTGENAGDVFVSKVNIADAGPSPLWTKRFGTQGAVDVGYAVAAHPEYPDLLYVGGRIGNKIQATDNFPIPPQNVYGEGASDGFLARLNSNGDVLWFQYLGGDGEDEVREVVQQPGAAFVVLGNTQSSNFPSQNQPGTHVFVARLADPVGVVDSRKIVGRGKETLLGHATSDLRGNIYFGGTTRAPDLALKPFDATFEPGGSLNDGFVAMLDSNLQHIAWASYVGGPSSTDESVRGVAGVPQGTITFVGNTSASAGVMVANAGQDLSAHGGPDGVAFRLTVDQNPPVQGSAEVRFDAAFKVMATWSGFRDDETDVDYHLDLSEDGVPKQSADLPYNASSYAFPYTTAFGKSYQVTVTATDLLGHSVQVPSNSITRTPPVVEPADGGSGDGGGAGGGDGGNGPGGKETASPLGWSCGSSGSGTLIGVMGLLALILLSRRRAPRA